ncbi:MAG: HlyD family efflux transporter periplasmic adaptor subunit [Proteobacteria bacterium]|nr:HlyD family efflux transporter periplasmic adaptor subunit [Pseudomonadota bacterium]MBU1612221.1 HlyD family efflux transporter periplasmic adaptor subunit [Pseudomonadota bacterium]
MNLRFGLLLGAALLLLGGCSGDNSSYQGWVEGEFVLVAAPLPGQLLTLDVHRGTQVEAGIPLFSLENAFETAAVIEAEQNMLQAERALDNLGKGRRPSELAAIEAQLREARSSLEYARTDYERKKTLLAEQTISQEESDRARNEYNRTRQTVNRIQAELATARLGGRTDEVAGAEAVVEAARAKLDQVRWNLDQKRQSAPMAGLVFDTFYERGEWVGGGMPVVSLLPPENIKIIFYVPEPLAGTLAPGQAVLVTFDGGPAPIPATVSYIKPEAEFTPPVIYSSQNRAKLVYLVEARPAPGHTTELRVGQPVDVTLADQTRKVDQAGE